jgi:hypothetical protein
MNTEVDFKALWSKEEARDIPDTKELFKKAGNLRSAARIRLIVQSVVLLVVVAILVGVGFNIDHKQRTTTVGLVLMLAGIVSYLLVSGQLLPMLFKSDIDASSKEYLSQLIHIKRKYEFLDKIMVDIYFSLLLAGVVLFGLQFAARMSTIGKISYYGIVIVLLIVTWVYSKAREFRKTLKPLNDTIKRLEAVNEQLRDGD